MKLQAFCAALFLCTFIAGCNKYEAGDIIPYYPRPVLPVYGGLDTIVDDWSLVYQHNQNMILTQAEFSNADRGIMAADYGNGEFRYSRTYNGGLSWSDPLVMPSNTDRINVINRTSLLSWHSQKDAAWDTGAFMSLLHPLYDTGWHCVNVGTSAYQSGLTDLQRVNDSFAYALSYLGELVNLFDPGAPYTIGIRSHGRVSWQRPAAFYFADQKNGWAVTYLGVHEDQTLAGAEIRHTSDAGMNWKTQLSDIKLTMKNVYAFDSGHAWISSGSGLYRTMDGGEKWTYIAIKKPDRSRVDAGKIIFVNRGRGFMASTNEVLETLDGGLSWRRSIKTGNQMIAGISFTSPNILWTYTSNRLYKLLL